MTPRGNSPSAIPRPSPTIMMLNRLCLRATSARSTRLASVTRQQRCYATSDRTSDKVPTNDPNPPSPVQNVSDTNAVPISAMGLRDAPLQEMPEDSEKQRQMQAPNRSEPWSRSQQLRERAMSGPRFEQTIMEFQVCARGRLQLRWKVHYQQRRLTRWIAASTPSGY